MTYVVKVSQVALVVKNLPANAGGPNRYRFDRWVGMIPWRRKWQPTPVFSPGESYGQRSLAGYSPWGHEESDKTEHAHTGTHTRAHTHTHTYVHSTSCCSKGLREGGLAKHREEAGWHLG